MATTFEKDTMKCFKKGTSGAETYTLAFWIKATKTGTHIVELDDRTNDRGCSKAFTVSSSDTWEHKVVNFPKDTSGPIGTGNARGFRIIWPLMHGGNYGSSSLQTTWGSSNTSARYTGQVNNADSTSNNWHLTGVQLEVGTYDSDSIPPFQHESKADNLQRCKRYYQKLSNSYEQYGQICTGHYNGTTQFQGAVTYPVEMNSPPVLSYTSTSSNDSSSAYAIAREGSVDYIDTLLLYNSNAVSTLLYTGTDESGTNGVGGNLYVQSTISELAFKAEMTV